MYNSISITEIKGQLTPDEQKILNSFQDPDTLQPRTIFRMTDDCCRELLGVLMSDTGALSYALQLGITGEHFPTDQQGTLFQILTDHYKTYSALPTKAIIDNHINDKVTSNNPETEKGMRLLVRAELNTTWDYNRNRVDETADYYRQQLREFAEIKFVRAKFGELQKTIKANKPVGPLVARLATDFAKLQDDDQVRWYGLEAIEELLNAKPTNFVIDGILALGEMSLWSGLPWAGKSTLLHYAIAQILQGGELMGNRCNPHYVLYINADKRPVEELMGNIITALPDKEVLRGNFELSNPCPIPVGFLEIKLREIKRPALVVIDTFRSGLLAGTKISENDAEVISLLTPLRNLAARYNSHVAVVHHNSRGKDEFAGSAVILGCMETHINVSRPEDSPTALVTVKRRGAKGINQNWNVTRLAGGELLMESASFQKSTSKSEEFINLFPTSEYVTLAELRERNSAWFAGVEWTDGTLKNKITQAIKDCKLEKQGGTFEAGRYKRR